MQTFHADYKHLRLLAKQVPEGWSGSLYDMQNLKWIDKGGWIYETREAAQSEAAVKAEILLGDTVPDLQWELEDGNRDNLAPGELLV